MLAILWALGVIDHIPTAAQVLRPDGINASSGWTASDTTLDGDTSDESDSTFASATADAAEMDLTLENPSPSITTLTGVDITVRVQTL